MHEANQCETCGSVIRRIQLREIDADGLTRLVDRFLCDCRRRPEPAAMDRS